MNIFKYLILILLFLGQIGLFTESKIYASYCTSNNTSALSGTDLTTKNVTYQQGEKYECLDSESNIIETTLSYNSFSSPNIIILSVTYGNTFSTELNATVNMMASPNTMIGTGSFIYASQNITMDFIFPLTEGVTQGFTTYFEPTVFPVTFTISDTEYSGEFNLSDSEPSTDLSKDGNVVGHIKIDQSSSSNIPVFKTYKYVSGNLVEL
mgnify:FL=1